VKPYKRSDRVADLVKRELAVMIQRKKDNPLFSGVTITYLRISPDLSQGIVFFTVLNKEKANETLEALNRAAGFFHRLLFKSLKVRRVPKLHFKYDESIARGQKLSALIDEAIAADKARKE
jgi:ribosome-binding factor A